MEVLGKVLENPKVYGEAPDNNVWYVLLLHSAPLHIRIASVLKRLGKLSNVVIKRRTSAAL
jgi:hypothetical protein